MRSKAGLLTVPLCDFLAIGTWTIDKMQGPRGKSTRCFLHQQNLAVKKYQLLNCMLSGVPHFILA